MRPSGRERDIQRMSALIVESLQTRRLPKKLWELSPLSQGPESSYIAQRLACEQAFFQLRTVYKSYPEELQTKFQQAVVAAVNGWSVEKGPPYVLEGLGYLVADTRALEAVTPIGRFVESDLIMNRGQERFKGALRTSIGLIEGATRFDETRESARGYLERWLENPDFEQYLSSIVNGLCRCSPDNYPVYLRRLLEVAGKHPEYFDLDLVVNRIVKIVTPAVVTQHFDDLPPEARKLLSNKN